MSFHSKSEVHITPTSRMKEFGTDTFVVEGDLLMCKVCNIHIDHVCKTISDH